MNQHPDYRLLDSADNDIAELYFLRILLVELAMQNAHYRVVN